ncbi:NAD(P)/FAD-dependent oxidoreductase [Candidatus Roizmanbacteria bacterium]|nr:NAD(P)/FAD-dependent oxidoreductase [Candidatus Roizmanbacteria bacterium]
MNEKNYDVVVIGSGDAGKAVAFAAAKKGKKVAIIDKEPFGGTCALRGCVPKKMLVSGAEVADTVRRMNKIGIQLGTGHISWRQLQDWKNGYISPLSADLEKKLHAAGIDTYQGTAHFTSETSVSINEDILRAKIVHIATGSTPTPLEIQGAECMMMSNEFLELQILPKRIIFIGGGYTSFELAHVAARAGSEVMILHRSARLLKEYDQNLVDVLVKASQEIGIIIQSNHPLVKIEKHGSSYVVFTQQEGREIRENADLVVHGAGRIPDIQELDLEQGNVAYSKNGITVNRYLQSISNSHVFAAGDAAGTGPLLTPVAVREGEIAAYNILHKTKQRIPDYTFIPSVVFTIPYLAKAGYTEEQAHVKGLDFDVYVHDMKEWFHHILVNQPFGMGKVLVQKKTGKIIGAHVLGEHADNIINLFSYAMQHKMTIEDIKKPLYAYPTSSGSVEYMLD